MAGHDNFIVKVPNKAGSEHIAEGREVKVGWKTADCRALDFMEFCALGRMSMATATRDDLVRALLGLGAVPCRPCARRAQAGDQSISRWCLPSIAPSASTRTNSACRWKAWAGRS